MDPELNGPAPVLNWPILERCRDRRGRLEDDVRCQGLAMYWWWSVDSAIWRIAERLRLLLDEREGEVPREPE